MCAACCENPSSWTVLAGQPRVSLVAVYLGELIRSARRLGDLLPVSLQSHAFHTAELAVTFPGLMITGIWVLSLKTALIAGLVVYGE